MEPLPQPPAPQPHDPHFRPRPLRAWQLTPAWRTVFAVGWAGALLGVGAVLKTARTMGLSTWWLGPEADPRFIAIQAVPFVIPVLLIIGSFRGVRLLPYAGIIGAVVMAAIAAGDLGRFRHLAVVQFCVAAVGLLISVASLAGMLRPDADAEAEADAEADQNAEASAPMRPSIEQVAEIASSEPTN